ncbi:MAG: hypothetical protein M3066_20310, partial [Actinomycetota bacterium]|nr:hypothetical protein [Actinomycetota bacterium]
MHRSTRNTRTERGSILPFVALAMVLAGTSVVLLGRMGAAATARGTAIVNLLPLQPGERVQTIIDTRDYETNQYLFFATRMGRVKKTRFTEYD